MSELVLQLAAARLESLMLLEETAWLNRSDTGDLNLIVQQLNQIKVLWKGKKQFIDKVSKIEELGYRIEDFIESYIVRGINGIKMMIWLRKLRLSCTLRTMRLEMKNIIKHIETSSSLVSQQINNNNNSNVVISSNNNNIINNSSSSHNNNNNSSSNTNNINIIINNNNNNPIGLENDQMRVCGFLLSNDNDASSSLSVPSSHIGVPVISICGVVGSGKTTLAKLIIDDPKIAKKFQTRKWINIPNTFETKCILDQIIKPGDEWKTQGSEEQLLERIQKILEKSLIVLDDIRSREDWETLCGILPKLDKGTCVLVTTRVGYVATYISQNRFVHNMTPLNEVDGRKLFTQVLSREDQSEQEMITDIVRCCDGSPQRIMVLALYLQSKGREEWETVHRNTRAFLSKNCCPVNNELRDQLQPFFMYLGHFLEDHEIDPEKLFHLWMIEGLLSTRLSARGKSMMDMTEQYLRELALKGMVDMQAEEVPATSKKFKACRFVQGIKKFCVSCCEQKRFLKIIDLRQDDCSLSSSDEPCRLVIYLGKHKVDISPKVAKYIRSLRVILRNQDQILENELFCLTKMLNLEGFGVLRILDFDGIDFQKQKLPKGIFNLELLRYLSFKGCILEKLSSSICKLSYLQELDLRVEQGSVDVKIPNVLQQMRRLKHLYLPLKFTTQKGEQLRVHSLTELETLVNFNTRFCRAGDVLKLCKLHHLTANVEENFADFESITKYMDTSSNNRALHCSIEIINLNCHAMEWYSVLQKLLRCKVLRTLHFEGYIGRLPPYDEISENLSKLVLSKSCINEDPMPILEKLPSLGILILSNDSYLGKKIVCSASGFPQLKCLQLLNLSYLQSIEVENTAMPLLSNIEINNCRRLEDFHC